MKVDGNSMQNLVQQAQDKLTDAIGGNDGNSLLKTDKSGKKSSAAEAGQQKAQSLLEEEMEQLTDADASDEAVRQKERSPKNDRAERAKEKQAAPAQAEEAQDTDAAEERPQPALLQKVRGQSGPTDLARRIGASGKSADAASEAETAKETAAPARAIFQATTSVEANEAVDSLHKILDPDEQKAAPAEEPPAAPAVLPFRFGQAVSQFSYLLKSFDHAVRALLLQMERKLDTGKETDADLVLYSLYLPPLIAHAAEQPFIMMDRRSDPSPAFGDAGMIYFPDGKLVPFDMKQHANIAETAICIALQNKGYFTSVSFERGVFEMHQPDKNATGILDAVVAHLNKEATDADAFTTRELRSFLVTHLRERSDQLLRLEGLVSVLVERVICGILDVRLLLRDLTGQQAASGGSSRQEKQPTAGPKKAGRPGGTADMLRSLSRGTSKRKAADYKAPK